MYRLAERLGCFVQDIEERMTAREYLGWMEYLSSDRSTGRAPEGMKAPVRKASTIIEMLRSAGIEGGS